MVPEQIARDLRLRIRRGDFAPGQELPSALELAEHYQVSAATAVEALAVLVRDGTASPTTDTRLALPAAPSESTAADTTPGMDSGRDSNADTEADEYAADRNRVTRDLAALRAALDDESIMWTTSIDDGAGRSQDASSIPDPPSSEFRALRAVAKVVFCSAEDAHGPIERTTFTKSWTGGLVGISEGVLLSEAPGGSDGPGYVGFEVFTGTLAGLEGRVTLQQYEVERAGVQAAVFETVPGSGTGGLEGLSAVIDLHMAGDTQHVTVLYRFGAGG